MFVDLFLFLIFYSQVTATMITSEKYHWPVDRILIIVRVNLAGILLLILVVTLWVIWYALLKTRAALMTAAKLTTNAQLAKVMFLLLICSCFCWSIPISKFSFSGDFDNDDQCEGSLVCAQNFYNCKSKLGWDPAAHSCCNVISCWTLVGE